MSKNAEGRPTNFSTNTIKECRQVNKWKSGKKEKHRIRKSIPRLSSGSLRRLCSEGTGKKKNALLKGQISYIFPIENQTPKKLKLVKYPK